MTASNDGLSSPLHRIKVSLPRGNSDVIMRAANERGVSVSALVRAAVYDALGLSYARSCIVCGNPLPDGRSLYCSEACTKARAAQAREARRKRLSQSQPPED